MALQSNAASRSRKASLVAAIAAVGMTAACGHAAAAATEMVAAAEQQAQRVPAKDSPFTASARALLQNQVAATGGELEIEVGEPDSRLQLAPCDRFEPFIPSGARLAGRTTLGIRCLDGARWTIYLPVQLRLFGAALVASRPLARGQPITADDVRIDRVDLMQYAAGALFPPTDTLEGKVAARALSSGEVLRRDVVRAAPVMQAGDPVKVSFGGTGFAISTEGKALGIAGDGETARVAVGPGRVVSGIARVGPLIEVR